MSRGVLNGHGEVVTQDSTTYCVHLGHVYGFYTEDTDLDTGENLDTLLAVCCYPLHIVFDLQAFGGQVVAYIYEDVVTSSDGTELNVSSYNRTITKNFRTKIYNGPSITNLGTLFVQRRVLSYAQGSAKITSEVRSGAERILKPNTKYLLRVTSAADNVAVTLSGIMSE